MMYEMLTGRLPFEADNAVSVAIMQMQSEATVPHLINADIPEGLEQITLKAMQKDTSKRYQSAAEMLSDIDEFKRNPSIKFEYTYFEDETPTRYVDAITRIRGEGSDDEGSTSKTPKTEDKNKGMMLVILGVVAALVVFGSALFIMFGFGNGLFQGERREEIRVDNFIGMNYEEEVLLHENIGNYEIVLEKEYNADYEYGVVFKQDPAPDAKTKMRGKLTLYISIGTKAVEIPSMNPGESVNLVKNRLLNAGFEVEEVEESSTEFKEGLAIRVSPEPGEKVKYGSVVTLYISSGPPKSEPISMPNVLGAEVGDAIDMLVKAGFERSKIKTEEVNDSTKKGTVVAVSPNHEEKQLPDVTITLSVSTGFANVEVKLELPDTDEPIDLVFYVGGKKDTALSEAFIDIKPKEFANDGFITFTVNETKEKYNVSVGISKAGANNYKDYAVFEIDGVEGTYVLKQQFEFNTTTTTTTTSTTATTADPTAATSTDSADPTETEAQKTEPTEEKVPEISEGAGDESGEE